MSFTDDNAIDFEMELPLNTVHPVEADQTETSNQSAATTEIKNAIKEFVVLSREYTESCNKSDYESITSGRNICSTIMEEKFQLLCDLNIPVNIQLLTAMQIDNMHKQQLQKLNGILKDEKKYARAYAEHCENAIKAAQIPALKEGHDEYTDMSHAELMERIVEMKNENLSIQKSCEEYKTMHKLLMQENQLKYSSILKETANLESYEIEAIEVGQAMELKRTQHTFLQGSKR